MFHDGKREQEGEAGRSVAGSASRPATAIANDGPRGRSAVTVSVDFSSARTRRYAATRTSVIGSLADAASACAKTAPTRAASGTHRSDGSARAMCHGRAWGHNTK